MKVLSDLGTRPQGDMINLAVVQDICQRNASNHDIKNSRGYLLQEIATILQFMKQELDYSCLIRSQ